MFKIGALDTLLFYEVNIDRHRQTHGVLIRNPEGISMFLYFGTRHERLQIESLKQDMRRSKVLRR